MKILFVCGSVEPGKDGVGDYTKLLATEFENMGAEAVVVAVNEAESSQDYSEVFQRINGMDLKTYRMSGKLPWKHRIEKLREILISYTPDLVSLQFVPFSFQKKGLPFFLPRSLSSLNEHCKNWHVMFHELWVADSHAGSVKELVLRELQKFIIRRLLKMVRFRHIATSNPFYASMLARIGYNAAVMPIFSNLPKGKASSLELISNREQKIVGLFFGHVHYHEQMVEKIRQLARQIRERMGKGLVIGHVGNNQNYVTRNFFSELASVSEVEVLTFGFLDANDAADVFAGADIGLSNYPLHLIGKSGSIASLLYNGLPVVLLDENWEWQHPEVSYLRPIGKIECIDAFINQDRSFAEIYSPASAATKFAGLFSGEK